MDRAVGVCKKVVSAFSYSWKKKSALSKAQQRLNLPPHQLITESLTRWGSRQKMVARVLEQQKAIIDVLSADKKNRHLIPTWQDVEVLESVGVGRGGCAIAIQPGPATDVGAGRGGCAIAIQPGPATDVGAWRRGVRDRKKKKKRSSSSRTPWQRAADPRGSGDHFENHCVK